MRDELKENPDFIEQNKSDLCASLQKTVVDILMKKLIKAAKDLKIKDVALAGGVSANSGLRTAFEKLHADYGWNVFIPKFAFTTDNAAMVASAGYRKYCKGVFCDQSVAPYSRTML